MDNLDRKKLKKLMKTNKRMMEHMEHMKMDDNEKKQYKKLYKTVKKMLKHRMHETNDIDTILSPALLPSVNLKGEPTLTTLGTTGTSLVNSLPAPSLVSTNLTTNTLGTPQLTTTATPLIATQPNFVGVSTLGSGISKLGSVGLYMNPSLRAQIPAENINVSLPNKMADSIDMLNSQSVPLSNLDLKF